MRLREPFVFFVDRSLGGLVVPNGLRSLGEEARAHDELFAQDTDDDVWLADVGDKGWVVRTKDVRIRRESLPLRALLTANVAAFVFSLGDVTGAQMVTSLGAALPRMKRALRRFDAPFIASLSLDGHVSVVHDATGALNPPKRLK